MKKVTELEHFVNEHAINGNGKICAIAASIEANKIGYCKKMGWYCSACQYAKNKQHILEVLLREHKEKPKLTEDEKVILRNIDKTFKWITRDCDNELVVHDEMPIKTSEPAWFSDNSASLEAFEHLFQFVKREDNDPYLIEDLLKEE